MKITKMRIFCLDIPMSNPATFTFYGDQVSVDTANQVGVKLVNDEGVEGWGLTSPVPPYHGMTAGMIIEALKFLTPFVEGQDPTNIERIHDVMDWALRGSQPAKCAVDLALYDLVGKATGLPAYALLGGKRRDDFETTFTLPSGRGGRIWSMDELASEARGLLARGFRAFEVHIGTAPGKGFHQDLERIATIRGAVGDQAAIDADAHRNWTVKEAILAVRELERYNVMIEQPVATLDEMAEVRRSVGATIIADEGCQTWEDGVEIIKREAADAFCIKPIKAGGLYKAKRLAILAESFGLLTRVDGVPGEGKLSNGASAHLVLTLKHPIVCGVMQHDRNQFDLVVEGGMEYWDGRVSLPDLPGLGVTVDESMVTFV
ncbi:MAG: mandelate racemase/muconate lactonizing enzyme family protein [Firmicutes bacterium]|nr:mandelate racemase/muconate lactonizing enzyme family protein [Bacillota bacterium]